MKKGKYFLIPEGPADIEGLWRAAKPLQPADLPSWLSPEDAAAYRCAGATSCTGLSAEEKTRYFAELEQFEASGLVAEPCADGVHRLFVDEWKKNKYDVWSIGIYAGNSPFDLVPAAEAENPVLTRECVSDIPAVFVADPFMLQANGLWHMFFEVLNWRTDKGEIALAISEDGLAWTYQKVVLSEPFHLSYPYVFSWMNEYYMIPESCQAGEVRLYTALEFPWRWSLLGVLFEGPHMVDSSIVRFADRWWLFVGAGEENQHDTLRLYRADDLRGPWIEHPNSPIVQGNARISRPGGRLMVMGGRVVRIAQDCRPHYGTQVRAFEVTDLTPEVYQEREVERSPVLAPGRVGWNACGMHHVDAQHLADGRWLACVDGLSAPSAPGAEESRAARPAHSADVRGMDADAADR
jgi:hypothetical protein